ncbi:MAG TPA: SPJ_0845 family protein [Tetragenococcus sp.]|nr:SPJ_0845 family protein [Tetragenococcus sp.]
MGLKFKQDDLLKQRLEEFAILPDEKKSEKKKEDDLERFLNPKAKKKNNK